MVSSQISAIEVITAGLQGFEVLRKWSALVDAFLVQHHLLPLHAFELVMFQLFGEAARLELPLVPMLESSPFLLAACSYLRDSD
jgi:hypothetical protein